MPLRALAVRAGTHGERVCGERQSDLWEADGAAAGLLQRSSLQTTRARSSWPRAGWTGASDDEEPNLQGLRTEFLELELEVARVDVRDRKLARAEATPKPTAASTGPGSEPVPLPRPLPSPAARGGR